jgi:hypothetical protein
MEIRFQRDMPCCKSTRVQAGMHCARRDQLCCAWCHVAGLAQAKGLAGLQSFAAHLLGFWPVSEVFWVFSRQMSALALVCAARYAEMPSGAVRDGYRADLAAATSPEFVATFDVLCEPAAARA